MTSTVEWIHNRSESSPSLSQTSVLTDSDHGIDTCTDTTNNMKHHHHGNSCINNDSQRNSSGKDKEYNHNHHNVQHSVSSMQDIPVQEPGLWKYSKTRQFAFW